MIFSTFMNIGCFEIILYTHKFVLSKSLSSRNQEYLIFTNLRKYEVSIKHCFACKHTQHNDPNGAFVTVNDILIKPLRNMLISLSETFSVNLFLLLTRVTREDAEMIVHKSCTYRHSYAPRHNGRVILRNIRQSEDQT